MRLIRERKVFPCFFGSALRLDGVDALLDALDRRTVQPEPQADFGARVFKVARDAQGKPPDLHEDHRRLACGPRAAFGRRGRRLAGKGQSAPRLFGRKIYRSCEHAERGHGGAPSTGPHAYRVRAWGWGRRHGALPPVLEPVLELPRRACRTAVMRTPCSAACGSSRKRTRCCVSSGTNSWVKSTCS